MLQKQPVAINFSKGLDTKTDPYQVPAGTFLTLVNSVFTQAGRLTKRTGFDNITTLPNASQTTLTTLNDNLIATGSSLYAYSKDTGTWLNQGLVQPVQLDTVSLVRSSTSQQSPDTAIASNGLCCLVYMDGGAGYYQVSDSSTGQQVVARVALPNAAVNPRVFILGAWFLVTFVASVSGTPTLQYIAIPTARPSAPNTAVTISANVNTVNAGYDAFAIDSFLFISWGRTGSAIGLVSLSPSLALSATTVISGTSANLMSVTVDEANQLVYTTWYENSGNTVHTVAYNYIFGQVVTPTLVYSGISTAELTSITSNGVLTIFYQTINNYSYQPNGSAVRSDYVSKVTVTPPVGVGAGTIGTPAVVLRSVGLASKPFVSDDSMIYILVTYGDTSQSNAADNSNQPTYFLINSSGQVVLRLAYSNGGGYEANQVLPSISLFDGEYCVPYQVTDFLTTVNKGTALPSGTPINAIYTQTGINLAKFTLNVNTQYSSEVAGALHLTGGQLWEYDGVRPVEHGFQVWPENVGVTGSPTAGSLAAGTYYFAFTYEWTDNQGMLHRSAPSIPQVLVVKAAPGAVSVHTTSGSPILTSVASFTNVQVGQVVTGSGIPGGAYIIDFSVGSATITLSANAVLTSSISASIAAVTSAVANVPTLRLTYKLTPNPVRIVGYRWSSAQQTYYQFTSITSPTLNNPAVDSVTITDSKSDAQILGQTLLYTTGGVIENIAAPASIASALFNNRLFLIDAEDRNLLWYSKQVIQNVPVEMSDLLTLYIAPTTGAQGSTGPMTALSAMDDKLIIFKKDAIYYINGSGPDNTGANSSFSDPIFVTSTVGCSNPNSLVLIPNGIMFQSDKGIWLLGRDLSSQYIGAPVEAYNDSIVNSAESIPGTNQVRFVLANNVTLMYDYFFNQWSTHTNKQAISATLYQGLHTYLNSYGQVFQETANTYVDGSTPVLMSLTTSWINIAGLQGYERFYFANLLGTYFTPFKINMSIAYDYNSSPQQSILVLPDNFAGDWGDEAQWGSGGPWGGPGNVFSARVFPVKQKCQSFQVTLQEVYDASFSVPPGQGLTLSGLALIVGMKKGYRTQKASRSFG